MVICYIWKRGKKTYSSTEECFIMSSHLKISLEDWKGWKHSLSVFACNVLSFDIAREMFKTIFLYDISTPDLACVNGLTECKKQSNW